LQLKATEKAFAMANSSQSHPPICFAPEKLDAGFIAPKLLLQCINSSPSDFH